MIAKRNRQSRAPKPDQVERALQAFREGAPDERDRLLGEDGGGGAGLCQMLALFARKAGRCRPSLPTPCLGRPAEPDVPVPRSKPAWL
jgi:hypothetical protein